MCSHVCTITYCLRGQRVQLRLPLCGVCGACRWERNKSDIDCRAALPPAGDPQTCRPGSKCFSPPKLAWEAAGAVEIHPQHWDCLRPNDGAGDRHTYMRAYTATEMGTCAHTHHNSHTVKPRLIQHQPHSWTSQTHTDINTPSLFLNTLIPCPKTIHLKFPSSHLRPPLKTTYLNHRFRGGILTTCPHTSEGGMNSITGTHACPLVLLEGKRHQKPKYHIASWQISSCCHFGSAQEANSICDEVSGVLLGWVQRYCDRISYMQTFETQYVSLPAHGSFYVNDSVSQHSSSLASEKWQKWIQRYRTMLTYLQFNVFLTDSWNCLFFGCVHGLNTIILQWL